MKSIKLFLGIWILSFSFNSFSNDSKVENIDSLSDENVTNIMSAIEKVSGNSITKKFDDGKGGTVVVTESQPAIIECAISENDSNCMVRPLKPKAKEIKCISNKDPQWTGTFKKKKNEVAFLLKDALYPNGVKIVQTTAKAKDVFSGESFSLTAKSQSVTATKINDPDQCKTDEPGFISNYSVVVDGIRNDGITYSGCCRLEQ